MPRRRARRQDFAHRAPLAAANCRERLAFPFTRRRGSLSDEPAALASADCQDRTARLLGHYQRQPWANVEVLDAGLNIRDAAKGVKGLQAFLRAQKNRPDPASGSSRSRCSLDGVLSAQQRGDFGGSLLGDLRVDLSDPRGAVAQPGLRRIEAQFLTGLGAGRVPQLHG